MRSLDVIKAVEQSGVPPVTQQISTSAETACYKPDNDHSGHINETAFYHMSSLPQQLSKSPDGKARGASSAFVAGPRVKEYPPFTAVDPPRVENSVAGRARLMTEESQPAGRYFESGMTVGPPIIDCHKWSSTEYANELGRLPPTRKGPGKALFLSGELATSPPSGFLRDPFSRERPYSRCLELFAHEANFVNRPMKTRPGQAELTPAPCSPVSSTPPNKREIPKTSHQGSGFAGRQEKTMRHRRKDGGSPFVLPGRVVAQRGRWVGGPAPDASGAQPMPWGGHESGTSDYSPGQA
ncbi:hypothetical protein Bbelb_004000 [Branchiostoma belcheri]|nr:hypothetical protein Bbelb_004000 [Branchiostoma belcheri]